MSRARRGPGRLPAEGPIGQARRVISPELLIAIGSSVSGTFVGPATAWPLLRGSNVAPWHGQMSMPAPGSQPTVQPAWVHTASNAAYFALPSDTTIPGSPGDALPTATGTWNWNAPAWETWAVVAIASAEAPPDAAPVFAAGAALAAAPDRRRRAPSPHLRPRQPSSLRRPASAGP